MSDNLGVSLMETISKTDLPSTIGDLGEVVIDGIMKDGIFNDIPILRTVISIAKTAGSVKDFLFLKKLASFLVSMNEMSEEDKNNLVARIDKDEKSMADVGAMLIELLSRLDDAEKPKLVAKGLKAYARGAIDFIQLQRINYAIDRLLMCDIQNFTSLIIAREKITTNGRPEILNYINAGLAYVKSGYGIGGISPSETGILFEKYIL